MRQKLIWFGVVGLLLGVVVVVAGCSSNSSSNSGATIPASSLTCTQCHNDTTLVLAKALQYGQSLHSDFEVASSEGTNKSCAGCHSSEGFVKRIAANITPDKVTEGETNPTPVNCRTCHEIHTTYTKADFGLRTTTPVTFYVSGQTFNFGEGNLCANCHQPRSGPPAVGSVSVNVTARFGPHHGPQSASFIGVGGYNVPSTISPHYQAVQNGCPTCHMVNATHDMTPDVAACQPCHSGATNFDIDGVQTKVKAQMDELAKLLTDKGLLKDDSPVVGTYPEAQAGALWNYVAVKEDKSSGVHNPQYLQAMLQEAIDSLK